MRVIKKRVGDIYYNPMFGDIWVLKKVWRDEYNKEIWLLSLINNDYDEELRFVKGFVKIGNIYDLCKDKIKEWYDLYE